MLPKELLDARVYRGRIRPRFAGEDEIPLAEAVLKTFREHVGKRYGSLQQALREMEDARTYRKVRGFAKVVERYCVLECPSPLDPVSVRSYLFEGGYVTSDEERRSALERAAEHFGVAPPEIEDAMFADMEDNLTLTDAPQMAPWELVRRYNLSLLQTSIFNALRLTIRTSTNHKEIFRRIKWLGLMYELYEDDGLKIEITGPASVLRMTKRYGTSMAKLIPAVVSAEGWWLKAEVLDERSNRILTLEMDDGQRGLFPEQDEGVEYDSSLEREFAWKMRSLLGVEVVREPSVLRAGRHAFIPDFLIRKGEKEVYVEIVGFWTPEYLKRKVEKLQKVDAPMLVVARDELGECDVDEVITFSTSIPYNEVVRRIKRHLSGDVRFEGDVIDLLALSDECLVPFERLKASLPEGYVVVGRYALRQQCMDILCRELEQANPERLSDALPVLERYGVSHDILPSLGYEVKWAGLLEGDAIVRRRDNGRDGNGDGEGCR